MRFIINRSGRPPAQGMSRITAVIVLVISSILQLFIVLYIMAVGFREANMLSVIGACLNGSLWLGMAAYILSGGRPQAGGYMEVSNYSNLNKIGGEKI